SRIVHDDSPRFRQSKPPDHERVSFDCFEKGRTQRPQWICVRCAALRKRGHERDLVCKLRAAKQTLGLDAKVLARLESRGAPYPADLVVARDAAENDLSAHSFVVLICEDVDQLPWHHI